MQRRQKDALEDVVEFAGCRFRLKDVAAVVRRRAQDELPRETSYVEGSRLQLQDEGGGGRIRQKDVAGREAPRPPPELFGSGRATRHKGGMRNEKWGSTRLWLGP